MNSSYRGMLLTVLMAAAAFGQQSPRARVTISAPASAKGEQVGCRMAVAGTAALPAGEHLWVLVRRDDFEGIWWPQNEGKVDPPTGKWSVVVQFGQSQDVGYDFDIAVIVVNTAEHTKLRNYRNKAMMSGDFRPIEMPPTTAPPQYRSVKKASHNGC